MNKIKTGVVYLIGAGPGDPGLITVRGRELLFSCDAVIYDHLVADELIIQVRPEVELHYVGKKAGDHPVPQEKINELMLRLARGGKNVARLKGSDPLVFGRGGEEAKFLKEHGIKFEIVTGVTSGIAAPAYAGIPCTDREKASFVLFVTGHKSSQKLKSAVPWEWVAKAQGGTLVIYMGVGEIENISHRLIKYGLSPDTPAAVIERGTYPSQRVVISDVQKMAGVVQANNIQPPALFVIGQVVDLRPWLEWFDHCPLCGVRVMVTRPADQAADLYKKLRELGAEPMPYPTIATEPNLDMSGWEAFKNITTRNNWLIFTSENGVRYFFDQYSSHFCDIRRLAGFKIAAIGQGTESALARYHLAADFVPIKFTVNDLASEFTKKHNITKANIIRIRGNLANDTFENETIKAGAKVTPITVYNTFHPNWPDGMKEKLFEHPPHAIMFTSGSSVRGLFHNLNKDEVYQLTKNAGVFSLGPMVSQIIEEHGLKITAQADEYTIDGLIKILQDHFTAQKKTNSQ